MWSIFPWGTGLEQGSTHRWAHFPPNCPKRSLLILIPLIGFRISYYTLDSPYLRSLIFLSYCNSCNRRNQPKSVPWRRILTRTRSRQLESLRRSPSSTSGRRWLENRKLYSNNGNFLPGCEGRSQAGCSSGDETAKKKSHRVQTLHVWPFWRKKSSTRRRRCWWWGRHQTTTNGRIINNSLWPPLQDDWPL